MSCDIGWLYSFNEGLALILKIIVYVRTTHDSKWPVHQAVQYHWILDGLPYRKYCIVVQMSVQILGPRQGMFMALPPCCVQVKDNWDDESEDEPATPVQSKPVKGEDVLVKPVQQQESLESGSEEEEEEESSSESEEEESSGEEELSAYEKASLRIEVSPGSPECPRA